MERRCDQCEWWDMFGDGSEFTNNGCHGILVGRCMRYPPVYRDREEAVYPLTGEDASCGEFRQKNICQCGQCKPLKPLPPEYIIDKGY